MFTPRIIDTAYITGHLPQYFIHTLESFFLKNPFWTPNIYKDEEVIILKLSQGRDLKKRKLVFKWFKKKKKKNEPVKESLILPFPAQYVRSEIVKKDHLKIPFFSLRSTGNIYTASG